MEHKKAALLIASCEYEDPHFRPLKAPAQDVESLSRVLSEPRMGGFNEVKTLINQPKDALIFAIEEFFDNRQRDDLLVLYFSCHGIKDEDGRLYYAARNTRSTRLVSTAVPAYQVNDLLARCWSRRKILVLDCCYSGAFSKGLLTKSGPSVGVMDEFNQGRGLVTLASSDAFQYSFEAGPEDADEAYSIFTRALVEGIETGKADEDGDQLISLDELYHFAFERVRREKPQQHPRRAGEVEGDIIIAHNPQPPEVAEIPLWLQKQIESDFPPSRLAAVAELDRLLQGRNRGLARSAYAALAKLKEDDSRKIADAAQTCLKAEDDRQASRQTPPEQPAPALQTQAAPSAKQSKPRRVPKKRKLPKQADRDTQPVDNNDPQIDQQLIGEARVVEGESAAGDQLPIPPQIPPPRRSGHLRLWIAGVAPVALTAAGIFVYSQYFTGTVQPANVAPPIQNSSPKEPDRSLPTTDIALNRVPDPQIAKPEKPPSVELPTSTETKAEQTNSVSMEPPPKANTPNGAPKENSKLEQAKKASPQNNAVKKGQATSPTGGSPNSTERAGTQPEQQTKQGMPGVVEVKRDAPAQPANNPPPVVMDMPSSPSTPNRITVAGKAQEMMLISQPMPVYPEAAIRGQVAGTVRFEAIVGKDGAIQTLNVITGHPLLVKPAVDAVMKWRYKPRLVDGKPVEVSTEINVTFNLSQ